MIRHPVQPRRPAGGSRFGVVAPILLSLALGSGPWSGTALGQTAPAEASAVGSVPLRAATVLDHYVHSPDPHYSFEVVDTVPGEGFHTLVVRMTSQAWLTAAEVDRPVWWHWLTVVVPDEVVSDTALLFIGGGDNDDARPTGPSDLLHPVATATGAVTVELRMVPNQPLTFVGDDAGPRTEDAIIAYGWDRFLRGGARDQDALWLARLPMTKAAVRAMDTVSAVTADLDTPVRRFVVAGGSKRGWTTWTTAAVDDRVVAIAPMVIDLLNVEPSFAHHWQAYGFWSPAVGDYRTEGIMEWQGRPEYSRLLEITEPFSYRRRLELPKLLINATGDEFFLPDSWKFYWDELSGEKHLRYVPNANHSLAGTDVPATLTAFLDAVIDGRSRPEYSWSVAGGSIEVRVDTARPPSAVNLWSAHNPSTRDFRVVRIRRTWESEPLEPSAPGVYRATVPEPAEGWTAFFVELVYDGAAAPLKVTSGVQVVPETLPHAAYVPDRSVLPAPTASPQP